jgi:hypothetical protein
LFHVQGVIQFADDFLGALKIIVNHHVRLGGVIQGKARQRAFERAERAFVEHQDNLSGRSGEGCDLTIRSEVVRCVHG